jgi:hypothetical protein
MSEVAQRSSCIRAAARADDDLECQFIIATASAYGTVMRFAGRPAGLAAGRRRDLGVNPIARRRIGHKPSQIKAM